MRRNNGNMLPKQFSNPGVPWTKTKMWRIQSTYTLQPHVIFMHPAITGHDSSVGTMIKRSSHLRSINNAKNVSEDNQADLFTKFLKDQCDRDFIVMHPVKGNRFRHNYILDLIKMEATIYNKYPPPNTEKSMPIHMRVPDNALKDFKLWYFDETTYGAVIVRDFDYFFILDPMDLVKFGRTDISVLFQNPIRVAGGYDQEAKPFTRVVSLEFTHNIYVGAGSF
ncbi:hypothetical protein R6Q59_019876 [Mikania micrantha]